MVQFLTLTCESLFKLLKNDTYVIWNEFCQEALNEIKQYLLNPHVLVPPTLKASLLCAWPPRISQWLVYWVSMTNQEE